MEIESFNLGVRTGAWAMFEALRAKAGDNVKTGPPGLAMVRDAESTMAMEWLEAAIKKIDPSGYAAWLATKGLNQEKQSS